MTHTALDDPHRLAAVRAIEVLGRPSWRDLDAAVALAAQLCDVPLAAISIFTETEQHHVATLGFESMVCDVDDALCTHTLRSPEPIVVPDCTQDPRYRDNPFVDGTLAAVRLYASVRLVTSDDAVVGTLCVFDTEVGHLDQRQIDGLTNLADRVVDVIELSVRSRELAAIHAEMDVVRAELQRSNDLLASFAGRISHDLKTPLTGINLTLSMAREEVAAQPGTTSAVELLDRALAGSTRMATMIDQVLAFAGVGGDLRLTDVDLEVVVQHVRSDLWERLQGVKLEVEGRLPVVRGDEVQLRALLQNLVDNAAKFADAERPPQVVVRGQEIATGWRVEVVDNGRGVPPGRVEQLFDIRARADESVDGSGIGLATCRLIAEAHGGRVGLDPAPHGGSVAWFELPR